MKNLSVFLISFLFLSIPFLNAIELEEDLFSCTFSYTQGQCNLEGNPCKEICFSTSIGCQYCGSTFDEGTVRWVFPYACSIDDSDIFNPKVTFDTAAILAATGQSGYQYITVTMNIYCVESDGSLTFVSSVNQTVQIIVC